jgi:hypothetical protein
MRTLGNKVAGRAAARRGAGFYTSDTLAHANGREFPVRQFKSATKS